MKKDRLINIITTIIVAVIASSITVYASDHLFASNIVSYDNTTSGIRSGNVQGAIDELYACASDYSSINTRVTNIENQIYPVGSIYISVSNTNPSTLFGGTWERISGRFLLSATDGGSSGASQAAGNTGGEASHDFAHTHTVNSHSHTYGVRAGTFWGTLSGGDSDMIQLYNNGSWKNGGTATYETKTINSGTLSSNKSQSNVAIFENTASTSTSSPNTNSKLGSITNIPPFLSVYMWKRTA